MENNSSGIFYPNSIRFTGQSYCEYSMITHKQNSNVHPNKELNNYLLIESAWILKRKLKLKEKIPDK